MTRNQLLSIIASAFLVGTMTVANAADATKPTDSQITERVKSTLFDKDRDIAPRIQVSTQDGVVTLSGNALTPQYAVSVIHDASRVDGVVKVQNHLTLD
jgi:osmotically-inducible protein OsmY